MELLCEALSFIYVHFLCLLNAQSVMVFGMMDKNQVTIYFPNQ